MAPYSIPYAIFLGPKQKYLEVRDDSGNLIETKITFKGVDLERSEMLQKSDFLNMCVR